MNEEEIPQYATMNFTVKELERILDWASCTKSEYGFNDEARALELRFKTVYDPIRNRDVYEVKYAAKKTETFEMKAFVNAVDGRDAAKQATKAGFEAYPYADEVILLDIKKVSLDRPSQSPTNPGGVAGE